MAVARVLLRSARRVGGGGGGTPLGIIALWSGLLVNIPANWSLCDGTGGTPNLVARFVRGAPAATEPGTVGGADSHTHTDGSTGGHQHIVTNHNHQHTVVSAGNHNHGSVAASLESSPLDYESNATTAGAHQHTVASDTHTHTMDAQGNHTHAISSDDGRPPYYEVAYIQAGIGAQVALNLVIIYPGALASIPAGWTLCDGGGGRPDLRSRFIRGINTGVTNPGTTGGATTHLHTKGNSAAHSHTEVSNANHSHTFSAYSVAHNHGSLYGVTYGAVSGVQGSNANNNFVHTHAASDSIGAHNHNPLGNGGIHTHVVNTASSLPAYYDVAFIINTGATTVPSGGILLWAGLLANIPTGYNLCDGGGGRPDLRTRFIRGSDAGVNPGGTGGSDTHSHTDVAAGAHNDHLETSAGTHQHAATDSIGAHTHGTMTNLLTGTAKPWNTDTSLGNHSHTYNNEDAHTHGLVASANHQHTWDGGGTIDGRPAYYEVAFLYKV